MKTIVRLQIPGQNKRERWHWARQRREVQQWCMLAGLQFTAQGLAKATGRRRVTITSFRRQRFHDEANLIGGCKGLIDGLVRAELLVDDSTSWATFAYAQALASASPLGRGIPCTVIEIEDA